MHKSLPVRGVGSLVYLLTFLLSLGMLGSACAEPLVLEKGIIDKDTVWEGEVLLKADVEVAKGVTLTIKPGTIVMFEKIKSFGPMKLYEDKTHAFPRIEIIVKGKIIARGTSDNMIFFSSVAPTPASGDWGAINLLNSKDNVIEYCDFSYAHTAIHAHGGQVAVSHCNFHDNGVAVGCKNIKDFEVKSLFTVENNMIRGNGMGLLFGGGSVMNAKHNEITDNALFGVYAKKGSAKSIIKYNNISRNGKGVLFWAVAEGFKISENNIADNKDYNMSIMEGTSVDVDASNNWWGTSDERVIKEKIMDKDEEEALGRVIYTGYASSPIPGAGVSNEMPK